MIQHDSCSDIVLEEPSLVLRTPGNSPSLSQKDGKQALGGACKFQVHLTLDFQGPNHLSP